MKNSVITKNSACLCSNKNILFENSNGKMKNSGNIGKKAKNKAYMQQDNQQSVSLLHYYHL